MLISHRKKFIYTKTYKTGSTSVESYFEKYCMSDKNWELFQLKKENEENVLPVGDYKAWNIHQIVEKQEYISPEGIIGYSGTTLNGQTWYNHLPASLLRSMLGQEVWDSYFKFCCIRNPFDKAISMFHWYIKLCEIKKAKEVFKDQSTKFISIKHNIKNIRHDFRQWAFQGGLQALQRDCKYYLIDGKICMDYIIRYENLIDGIKHVCDKLDIEFNLSSLPRLKSGVRPKEITYDDYYDSETIDAVHKIFRNELEIFNYSYPGNQI